MSAFDLKRTFNFGYWSTVQLDFSGGNSPRKPYTEVVTEVLPCKCQSVSAAVS